MRFNIANKAPVAITIDGTVYLFPRVRRPFWVEWGAEIDATRMKVATERLSPTEAAKMLLVYPIEPTGHAEMVRRLQTPGGVGRIIQYSATKANPPVPEDVLANWIKRGDEVQLESLALVLASIVDFAEEQENNAMRDAPAKEGRPDPLASAATGSKDS